MAEIVELNQAFSWDCPTCGREYFERGIRAEMSQAEERKLRDELEIAKSISGSFVIAPKQVKCQECDKEFQTTDHDQMHFW